MDNPMPRRHTVGKLATLLGALAIAVIAAAPARADSPYRHRRGGYRVNSMYRGTAYPRFYNGGWGGYRARGRYAQPPVIQARPGQLYVPPARHLLRAADRLHSAYDLKQGMPLVAVAASPPDRREASRGKLYCVGHHFGS